MTFSPLRTINDAITLQRFIRMSIIVLVFEVLGMAYVFQYMLFSEKPPLYGFDFAAFWSAAQLAVDGRAIDVFNGEIFGALQRTVIPGEGTLYWHYPPTMQLVTLPLAPVGFRLGYVLFTLAGMICLVWTALMVEPDRPVAEKLIIISTPFVWMNFNQGQNGAFIALILVMFLLSIERKHWMLAGFWGALLLIKPHFGVLLPLVVLLRGNWRVFGWGALFGGLFCGATVIIFGADLWGAFWDNRIFLKDVLNGGELAQKQISGYSFVQQLDLSQSIAVMVQAVTIALSVLILVLVWRSGQVSPQLRMATAIVCSLMISPYAFFYDASVAAVAIYLLVQKDPDQPAPRGGQILIVAAWYVTFIYVATKASAPSYGFYPAFMGLLWVCYRTFRIQTVTTKKGRMPQA